ncbi:hypothetical protein [Truepera radiovictrix]|uniref:Phosphoserine phosphatase n=1 Tax=Truepera radiovictrix (strain DSM 17093 / CIP 108686 / LMG 22925 / RQ-24) TaxID=649638 RepID=D7CWX9_TRURR|nr:hypothetical protein [Truepera radiovictrix]ADI14487.1 phosphoserine phosphatase [Truepera radiovictrix DSM 17093]WMT56960.1 hypothetical protein RCV51_13195 [Truepera radiovictrix]
MYAKRYFVARIFADYDAAIQTVEMVDEYSDPDRAERGRRAFHGELPENTLLLVTSGPTWREAEQELRARLGE